MLVAGVAGASDQQPLSGSPSSEAKQAPGVEAGEAEPIDRAPAVDERRRLQVAQERVVLDAGHQRFSISRPRSGQRFRTARLKESS